MTGHVTTTIGAGEIVPFDQPATPLIGKGFNMGTELAIYFTPAIAQQWRAALHDIAEQDNN